MISQESFNAITNNISLLRNGQSNIDDIIFERLMSMENYIEALDYFLQNQVTEQVILKVGMNRKSSERGVYQYDRPYYLLYKAICDYKSNRTNENVIKIYNSICSITGKASNFGKIVYLQTLEEMLLKKMELIV